jgi:hypothetical protein
LIRLPQIETLHHRRVRGLVSSVNIQLQSGLAQTLTVARSDMSLAADVAISDITTSHEAPDRPADRTYPSDEETSRIEIGARLISDSSLRRADCVSGRPAMYCSRTPRRKVRNDRSRARPAESSGSPTR